MWSGRYAEAADDYSWVLEIAGWTSNWLPTPTYRQRAKAYFHLGNYPAALADLRAAFKLKPSDLSTLTSIGLAEVATCPDAPFRQGILELTGHAIEQTKGDSAASVARARLYEAMGKYARAGDDWAAVAAGYQRQLDALATKPGADPKGVLTKLAAAKANRDRAMLRQERVAPPPRAKG